MRISKKILKNIIKESIYPSKKLKTRLDPADCHYKPRLIELVLSGNKDLINQARNLCTSLGSVLDISDSKIGDDTFEESMLINKKEFEQINMSGCKFYNVIFYASDLREIDFSGAEFYDCEIVGCIFVDVNLSNCKFVDCIMSDNEFSGCMIDEEVVEIIMEDNEVEF